MNNKNIKSRPEEIKKPTKELKDEIIKSYKECGVDRLLHLDSLFKQTVDENYKLYNGIKKDLHDFILSVTGEDEKVIINSQFTVRNDSIYKCYTQKEVDFGFLLSNNFSEKFLSQYDVDDYSKYSFLSLMRMLDIEWQNIKYYETEEDDGKIRFTKISEEVPESYRFGMKTKDFPYHIGYKTKRDDDSPFKYYTRGVKDGFEFKIHPAEENMICLLEPYINMSEIKSTISHSEALLDLVTKSYNCVSEENDILVRIKDLSGRILEERKE